MKCLILILILAFSFTSLARKPKSLSLKQEAEITFTDFNNCAAIDDMKNRLKCIKDITSENINKRLNQKISIWMSQVKLDKKLVSCPQDKMELFPKASSDAYKIVSCFDFKINKQDKKGIIYFLDENGIMKIDGIQFI